MKNGDEPKTFMYHFNYLYKGSIEIMPRVIVETKGDDMKEISM